MDTFLFRIFFGIFKLLPVHNINMEQVEVIASAKMTMDRRRKPPAWKRSQQKESSNSMLLAMFLYSLMSLFVGIMVMSIPDLMLSMIIVHTYFLFMLVMIMITDFSNVLLDTSDAQIILPKPVTSRTLLAARTLHIMVYLGQLVLAIMAGPLVFTFIRYGIVTGLTTIFTTLLTTATGIFLTYVLYGLVLRYTNEQKVKDIIGYFQIFMTIFFAVGYQLIPRLINLGEASFTFSLHWYSYLLPPVWMAGLTDAVYTGVSDSAHVSMVLCAVGFPLLAGWIILKYLAPYFSKFMSAPADGASLPVKNGTKNPVLHLSDRLASFCGRSDNEKASFALVWKITGRDKNFKMQFYPGLAYIPVFIFIIFFKNLRNVSTTIEALPDGNMFLWLLYMPMFSVALSLSLVAYYEHASASWVYQCTPVGRPGELINGAVKALLLKFFVPVYMVLSTVTLAVWGFKTIDDILLSGLNSVLIFYISAALSTHYLPFSQQPSTKEQGGKFVLILIRGVLIAVLVGLHWLALKVNWLVPALIPVSLAGYLMAEKKIKRLSWSKIVM